MLASDTGLPRQAQPLAAAPSYDAERAAFEAQNHLIGVHQPDAPREFRTVQNGGYLKSVWDKPWS
jgi:hypothetical protein